MTEKKSMLIVTNQTVYVPFFVKLGGKAI